jgi:hypothetical protein
MLSWGNTHTRRRETNRLDFLQSLARCSIGARIYVYYQGLPLGRHALIEDNNNNNNFRGTWRLGEAKT